MFAARSHGSRRAATLRDFGDADFETLYAIDQACYPPGIAYSRRMLRWYLRLPNAECIVAAAGPEIAGFILTDFEASEGHIITIDVLSNRRRGGIGSALLREAERRLAAKGVREVTLETATTNEAGIAFWQRHGYRTMGVIPRYYQGRHDAYFMRKTIRLA